MSDGRKPVIGLSLGLHDFGDYAAVGFQRPLALAGGVGLGLPRVNGHLEDALDACDGILLGGGSDIDPGRYGQEPTEHLSSRSRAATPSSSSSSSARSTGSSPSSGCAAASRSSTSRSAARSSRTSPSKPEWAEHPSDRGWRAWKEVERTSLEGSDEVPPHPRHLISIEPGSRLHAALGVDEIEVDSFHHQALDEVAPDLTVVATAPDGVVEAVEMDGDRYVLAVQWELQEEWRVDRRFLEPFAQFVSAASQTR